MKKNNTTPTALIAGLVALMAIPAIASANHRGPRHQHRDAPKFASGASCSLPSDYPAIHVDGDYHRKPRVERRLERRIRNTREQVRLAIDAMDGLRHWRADKQIEEAKRRVTDARWHVENGAFRAAKRTLDRVDDLVRLVRNKARELDRIRSAARSEMREYRRSFAVVQAKVDEANCTVAAAHLRKAEGAFGQARREADQLDWDTARTYARRANRYQKDALDQAVRTIRKHRKLRREYDEAVSTLDGDLRKARRAGARSTSGPARALLQDARRLKSQAAAAAQRRELKRAAELARRGSDSARGAFELAIADSRRDRRRARDGRHARWEQQRSYRTEMPFASASARWTSSEVW